MPENYIKQIELWDGKKVIATIPMKTHLLFGKNAVLCFAPSELKRVYGKRYETITVPICLRVILDDGMDYTIRRCLDIRKKSARQIALLKTWS